MFYLSEINKDDAALACLVSELDAFQRALYPAESHHCLDLSTVSNKKLRCVIVRDANGLPAGCGTLLLQDGNVGEIKRVYIRSEYRGANSASKFWPPLINSRQRTAVMSYALKPAFINSPL
ncbi:MAG: hypothetical protein LZT29_00067 [Pantoea stewartii]|nr:MAG: hypothetical protein LZT29_00067 [Pantoea stewartii]